ncbi:MAG: TonB-dependent receptor [Bacteroidota bacterium]
MFFFFFIFLLAVPNVYNAQEKDNRFSGSISGKLCDSINGLPIEYASIGLIAEDTRKTVNGITSDDKGFFKLNNIPEGKYSVSVYFIGYKNLNISNININKFNQNINLGQIKLINNQTTLNEVEVSTEKSLIENKIDKMVYNAEKDLTAQGGSASDILRKIPQISVDVNGNVDLQGNSNIRFLINGKPSSMFGNNVADVLRSIPANQIQSIEVITSPGAKYDAEGGGIINIILKKSNAKGYNGNMALTAGSRLENGALNLSARNNNIGVNAFVSGNAQLLTTTFNSLNRNSTDQLTQAQTLLHQNGKSDFNRNAYQGGMNMDWAINTKNTITAGFNYNYLHNRSNGYMQRQISIFDAAGTLNSYDNLNVLSRNESTVTSIDYNINYKKTFKTEGQEFEVLFSSSQGNNKIAYAQSQNVVTSHSIQSGAEGSNPGKDNQMNLSLNYVQPVKKLLTIETGLKMVTNTITSQSSVYLYNNIYNDYLLNLPQSNSFTYNRKIYAAYLSLSSKLFNFLDFKAGCRIENTQTNANYSQVGSVVISPYNTVVPSLALSHMFKDHQMIKLNYSRRISRPGYRDVNPFINANDPKNITAGNVNLKPEYSDNIECTYSNIFKKGGSLNLIGFFRGNYQDIQPYSRYYDKLLIGDSIYQHVAVSMRENIGTEYNTGITIASNISVSKIFSMRSNISTFYRVIKSIYSDGSINGWMYRINLTASFQFNKTLAVELFGNFNSPRINAQGIQPTFTTYNIAIRKLFFKDNASIAFTATNPFDKFVNQKTTLNGTNFTSVNLLQLPYRSFGINFTYKFGRMEFKKQKELEDANLTNPSAPGNNN